MFAFCHHHVFYYTLHLVFLSQSFFFNHPPTTEIYTLSLHDALPIYALRQTSLLKQFEDTPHGEGHAFRRLQNKSISDRKSTRLNSSHLGISYAVFCLKKKRH